MNGLIYIKNTQSKIKISTKLTKHILINLMKIMNLNSYDISLWITSNRTIKKLNKLYRQVDEPTDILSIPIFRPKKAGEIPLPTSDRKNLGDLIISAPYIYQASQEKNVDFKEHLASVLTHGLFHLIGYDHETEEQATEMKTKEMEVMQIMKENKLSKENFFLDIQIIQRRKFLLKRKVPTLDLLDIEKEAAIVRSHLEKGDLPNINLKEFLDNLEKNLARKHINKQIMGDEDNEIVNEDENNEIIEENKKNINDLD